MSQLWFRTITTPYRLRLGTELADHVAWITRKTEASETCVVIVGSHGQALLLPSDPNAELKSMGDAAVARNSPTAIELSEPWAEYLRYTATIWSVSWNYEKAGDRFTFVLPRELRDLKILPKDGDLVAIFAIGQIMELWDAGRWLEHTSRLAQNMTELTQHAQREFESR